MKVTYSHAEPYLRERALRAACGVADARTQRDRREKIGQLYAYVTSLRILLASPEGQQSPPGVADEAALPSASWRPILVEFLSADDWTALLPTLERP
jgi:hypothetical protein